VTLTATGSDGGSGLASVRIQRAATGSGVWTDVCTGSSSPTNCTWTTTAVTDGGYDLRAIATDAAGNATTSTVVSNRVVDNTAPTGVDVQTTNVSGGTAGKPQAGDVVTYTFSEPMLPASILSGWTGASTSVTVRFTNGNPDVLTVYNAANNTLLPLGSLTSGTKYVSGNTTFTASSMLLSGNSIVVTLGTPGGGTATANTATTLQWTTSTAATDRAGNPLVAATVLETGTLDLDF
jgi:chitinase